MEGWVKAIEKRQWFQNCAKISKKESLKKYFRQNLEINVVYLHSNISTISFLICAKHIYNYFLIYVPYTLSTETSSLPVRSLENCKVTLFLNKKGCFIRTISGKGYLQILRLISGVCASRPNDQVVIFSPPNSFVRVVTSKSYESVLGLLESR